MYIRNNLGSVPCRQRVTPGPVPVPGALEGIVPSLMGRQRGCSWVLMENQNGLHYWQWVCFGGGLNPTGLKGAANTLVDSNGTPLPYCDQVGIVDEVINWVKENPLLAGGAAVAAYFLLKKL